MEYLLAAIAYGAVVAAIVIFCRGSKSGCGQDCNQGRNCDCDD